MERQQHVNWMIIVPSLFTLGSVLCGMLSMYVATNATDAKSLSLAAWLIVGSMLCDGVDGRVARAAR
ncbi:MAG: CDP-alcohol phosphatidyltransferase family protein, partial [Myxococcota bacterium]